MHNTRLYLLNMNTKYTTIINICQFIRFHIKHYSLKYSQKNIYFIIFLHLISSSTTNVCRHTFYINWIFIHFRLSSFKIGQMVSQQNEYIFICTSWTSIITASVLRFVRLIFQSECQLHAIKSHFYVCEVSFPLRALLDMRCQQQNESVGSGADKTEINFIFICYYGI